MEARQTQSKLSRKPLETSNLCAIRFNCQDIKFHQCVQLARFENDRTISFIPSKTELKLSILKQKADGNLVSLRVPYIIYIYIHQNDFNVTLEHVCQVCVHSCLLLEHRVKCWVIDVDDSMTLRSPRPKCFYSVKNGNNATSHLSPFKNDKCKSSDVSRVVHRCTEARWRVWAHELSAQHPREAFDLGRGSWQT